MTQKTFDGQTATFISKLVASFPGDLKGEEMQKCIDDPKGLRDAILAYIRPALVVDRITFTVTGLGLTGAEWVTRLEAGGHKLYDGARDVLMKPDYDLNHRLEAGVEYKVSLVFGKEILKDSVRMTKNLKVIAKQEFGGQSVTGLKGELALLIREKFTNAELEAMGLLYIGVLHEPIIDHGGNPRVLRSHRGGDESCVSARCDLPGGRWDGSGAFAFFAS